MAFSEEMYADSGAENSRQGVQPLRTMYSTCLEISSSERGGKKEKVSKNLKEKKMGRGKKRVLINV